MSKSIIILGGGGHASVLLDILLAQGRKILAVVSPDDISGRKIFADICHLKNDDDVLQYHPTLVSLVNGIGVLPGSSHRHTIGQYFLNLGYQFESVVANNASVAASACLDKGVQVLHGAIIQAGASIGGNTIINTGAIIEHDCQIGENNHIASRAILCGQVITKENVFVGAGATIIQNITIERDSIVGAGVTITRALAEECIAYSLRPVIKKG